jgi:hypothetical protein
MFRSCLLPRQILVVRQAVLELTPEKRRWKGLLGHTSVEDLGVIRVRGSYEALENISNATIIHLQSSSPIMHSTYN